MTGTLDVYTSLLEGSTPHNAIIDEPSRAQAFYVNLPYLNNHEEFLVRVSGVVHLHRKVVVSLSVGSLPTYLVFFFGGGVILIPSGGSIAFNDVP